MANKSSSAPSPTPNPDAAIESAFRELDRKRKRPWKGEEEVRVAWIKALENATGFHFNAERDREDLSFNNVIIEFKSPGAFKGKKSSAKFKEAVNDRLLPYILDASKRTKIAAADFIGIAIDGEHLCFVQVINGQPPRCTGGRSLHSHHS